MSTTDGHHLPPCAATPEPPERQWCSVSEATGADPACGPDEFPSGAAEWDEGLNRRRFLHVIGASAALAASGCTKQPREEIVPYLRQPEELTPGLPLYFATAMELGGAARGLLVRSNEGRPTKIEGNPDHPTTLGRSSVHMQAELLSLYDPERSQNVWKGEQPASWEDFLGALTARLPRWRENAGAGVRLLTRRVGSPTLREQIAAFLQKYPQAKWDEHDPAYPPSPAPARLRIERAEVIVSLDADLFGYGSWNAETTLAFARRREPDASMSRLYVVESMPSLTGSMADHRRALRPGEIEPFARQLLDAVRAEGPGGPDLWIAAVARDLRSKRGRSVIVAGEFQPPAVHALARAMNEALGNVGQTVDYPSPAPTGTPLPGTLPELTSAMAAGRVEALLILDANPAYDAPVDLGFRDLLAKVPLTVHLGTHRDETARRCVWHIPKSHFLESWSDAQTEDGQASIVQPLIDPLYPSHTAHELLAALLGQPLFSSYDIIRGSWKQRYGDSDFEKLWRKSLHNGVGPKPQVAAAAPPPANQPIEAPDGQPVVWIGLELLIRPDPHLLDGRFSNNGWLQELPKPFTRLTWENAAHVSPKTARDFHLELGDVVELRYRGRTLRAPVWILPGHADNCVTIQLGYGRESAGAVGSGRGFNAFALQTSDAPWGGAGLEIHKTGDSHRFSATHGHWRMAARAPVRVMNLGEESNPEDKGPGEPPRPDETLYPEIHYGRPAWGMVINLNTCIGCSSCTIACQAENNIPVVGREQVIREREMHWIRVDRYYAGSPEAPQMLHQPVPCMHCENAPCELVCPVAATVHDHAGLNVMVYNRCIGTRYCSNNCPYKVRRFNFLKYNDTRSPQLKLMRNPDVTVRMRGVMEKCTYCLQRISAGRIAAEKENRPIRDGEVVPACAQACPADAIIFGDINDDTSRVAGLRRDPRHYDLLGELNTRPRTTYLARVQNPNPEIPA